MQRKQAMGSPLNLLLIVTKYLAIKKLTPCDYMFKLTYDLANIRQILYYGVSKVNILNFPRVIYAHYVGYVHRGYID